MISELEREILDKDKLLKRQGFNNEEDQGYIELTNQVLNNVHLEYVWRAVKQVLRHINVSDFTDNDRLRNSRRMACLCPRCSRRSYTSLPFCRWGRTPVW